MANRKLLSAWLTAILCVVAGCGPSPSATPSPSSAGLSVVNRTDLGLAYASSSVNVAVFRQSAVVTVGDGHIVAYYDAAGYVRLVRLSADNSIIGQLRVLPKLSDARLGDGHDIISLGLSADGLVHVIFGAHGYQPLYAAFSPDRVQGTDLTSGPVAALWPATVTYPQFYTYGAGLHLWYRCNNMDICVQEYSAATHKWNDPVKVLAAGRAQSVYMNRLAVDGNTLVLSWVYRMLPPPPSQDVLNDGTYLLSSHDSGKTWRDINLQPVALPVAQASVPRMLFLPVSLGLVNQSSAVLVGQTYVLADLHQDALGRPQIFLSMLDLFSRDTCTVIVSESPTAFDLVGKGTLTLPLSRAEIAASDRFIHVIYRQAESLVVATAARTGATCPTSWQHAAPITESLTSWEPNYDHDEWLRSGRLLVYVQSTRQGPRDTPVPGAPTQASVYQLAEKGR